MKGLEYQAKGFEFQGITSITSGETQTANA